MQSISLDQIRMVLSGNFASAPIDANQSVTQVSTDTRSIARDSLFIALKGDRFDAHDFLGTAIDAGAVAAVVDHAPTAVPQGFPLILVNDTRRALGDLAQWAREQMTATVVAVAGSNGKTSTKYLIDSVLGTTLRGSMSPKSFNNDIGVPLTILPADPTADYLVLELGTNHPGEIKRLTEIARPDVAVITNCGAEHLEFLTDLDGVRAENASIVDGVRPNGTMIINGDDPGLVELIRDSGRRVITFGFNAANDFYATSVECDPGGTRFHLNDTASPIFVNALGRHAALNALAAIAVAREFGRDDDTIANALANAKTPDMRLQLNVVGDVRVLNDAYNANPNSMRAALETLSNLKTDGRKIAVLGDMRELGDKSSCYHREIGEFVAACGIGQLICVGTDAMLIASAAASSGLKRDAIHHFANASEAAAFLPAKLREGDLVLLKASRGVGLEAVARAITEARSAAETIHLA